MVLILWAILQEPRVVALQVDQGIKLLQSQAHAGLDHIPGHTLSARRGGQAALVLPTRRKRLGGLEESFKVDLVDFVLDLLFALDLQARLLMLDQEPMSLPSLIDLPVQSRDPIKQWVRFLLDLQQDPDDGQGPRGFVLMDQMQLCICEMVIDTMFRGGMEMELDQIIDLVLDLNRLRVRGRCHGRVPVALDRMAIVAAEDVPKRRIREGGKGFALQMDVGRADLNVNRGLLVAGAARAIERIQSAYGKVKERERM